MPVQRVYRVGLIQVLQKHTVNVINIFTKPSDQHSSSFNIIDTSGRLANTVERRLTKKRFFKGVIGKYF